MMIYNYSIQASWGGRLIYTDEYIEIPSPYPIHVYHNRYLELGNNAGGASLSYEIYYDGNLLQPIHSSSPFFTYEVELNKIITIVNCY